MFYIYGNYTKNSINDEIYLCSIDPGKTNFAIRIESRNIDGNIKVLLYELINLRDDYFTELTKYLDSKLDILNKCNIFVMEEQQTKNRIIYRIAQHVLSYFIIVINKNQSSLFYEINPRLKERLGYNVDKKSMPNNGEQKTIKMWSINKAIELLQQRGDKISLNVINNAKKKDDLADVVCQLESFCKFVDIFKIFKDEKC